MWQAYAAVNKISIWSGWQSCNTRMGLWSFQGKWGTFTVKQKPLKTNVRDKRENTQGARIEHTGHTHTHTAGQDDSLAAAGTHFNLCFVELPVSSKTQLGNPGSYF